jgi:hypothetical protein
MRNGVGHPDGMTTSSFYLVLSVCLSFCLFVILSICHSVSFGFYGGAPGGGAPGGGAPGGSAPGEQRSVLYIRSLFRHSVEGEARAQSRRFSTSHRVPHAAQFPRAVRCRCQCIEPEIKKTIRFSDWRSEIQAGCAVTSSRNCSVFRGCSYFGLILSLLSSCLTM